MSNFTNFFLDECILNHPEQAAIIKLSAPRLVLRFNYEEKYIADLSHFKEEINEQSWLDGDVVHPVDEERIIEECFEFLTEHRKAVFNLREHE